MICPSFLKRRPNHESRDAHPYPRHPQVLMEKIFRSEKTSLRGVTLLTLSLIEGAQKHISIPYHARIISSLSLSDPEAARFHSTESLRSLR